MEKKIKTINVDLTLFPWQTDAMDLIGSHQGKTIVIKARRQVGKSVLCEWLAIKTCLENRNGSVYYMLPSFKQARKVFDEVKDIVEGKFFVKKIDNQLFQIRFINGSVFQLFSSEQKLSALQGYFCKSIMIYDECAYLSEESIQASLPWTNAYNPTIIAVSTPLYEQGTFYNLWCQGIDASNDEVYAIDFCDYDTSALLSPSKLEYYRKTLPSIKFKQMYEGRFASTEGAVFGDFAHCFYPSDYIPSANEVVFGIDWSSNTGNDYNAITIMNAKKEVVDIIAFNDKEASFTVDYICKLAEEYHPKRIICEQNSIGQIYLELLRKSLRNRKLNIPVVSFLTTNDSKSMIVSQLQVAIQNGDIRLPKRDDLMMQLSSYEMIVNANNKPVFNARSGQHDDILMSLMIALDAVTIKRKSSFL